MKKVAIFTEGLTEQLFVCSAIKFLAANRNLHIKRQKLLGGKKFPTILMDVGTDEGSENDCELFYLLIDCASDERVVTAINERYQKLLDEGFSVIFGVRDLRPDFTLDQLDRLVSSSRKSLPTGVVEPGLIVAVMEAEAWFLAEYSHFNRMDNGLNLERIRSELSIELDVDSQSFENPAKTLSKIYDLVGLEYGKSHKDVSRTIEAIDLSQFRVGSVFDRSPSSKLLFDHLHDSMETT